MNYIFYLTERCNLNCQYCYENKKSDKELTFDIVKSVLDNEVKNGYGQSTLNFYGGEPTLRKDLIYKIVEYSKEITKKKRYKFYYTMTTNCTLIDGEFIKYAKKNKFNIACSIDGPNNIHNLNRKFHDGTGSFDIVFSNAIKLEKYCKNTVVMLVVTLNNVEKLAESVLFLFENNFKCVNISIDYTANWTDDSLNTLKKQYEKISEYYLEALRRKRKISFLPFDEKIFAYTLEQKVCDKCEIASKHICVFTDGKYYPCIQFVGKSEFCIGDYKKGLDAGKIFKLVKSQRKQNEICVNCYIKDRCKHGCACINLITTGNISESSSVVCINEKNLVEISDKMANELYLKNKNIFNKKFC